MCPQHARDVRSLRLRFGPGLSLPDLEPHNGSQGNVAENHCLCRANKHDVNSHDVLVDHRIFSGCSILIGPSICIGAICICCAGITSSGASLYFGLTTKAYMLAYPSTARTIPPAAQT